MALLFAANYSTLADSYGVGFTNVQYQQDGGAIVNNAAGIPGANHALLGNSLYCTLAPNEVRREATPPDAANDFGEGEDVYFRFDFVLDTNYELNTTTRHHILSQIHSASATASPVLEFDVVDAGLYTRGASDAPLFNLLYRRLVDLAAGVKYSVIFRVKFSLTPANCLVEVWVNGTQVLSEVPTHAMINGGGNSYWKGAGVYRAASFDSTEGCWQSNHAFGTAYNDVAQLAAQGPALVGTLVDDFSSGALAPARWTATAGVGVTAGRMSIPCQHTAGTPAYLNARSTDLYVWPGSALSFEVPQMPAAGGGAAFAQMWLMDPTPAATVDRLGLEYRAAANALDLIGQSGAGYAAIGATTSLTYDPVAHRWLRIRHLGASIVWDTSTDGVNWTLGQRTLATPPTWASEPVRASFEAYRTGGTNDVFLVDNVNVTTSPAVSGGLAFYPDFLS